MQTFEDSFTERMIIDNRLEYGLLIDFYEYKISILVGYEKNIDIHIPVGVHVFISI